LTKATVEEAKTRLAEARDSDESFMVGVGRRTETERTVASAKDNSQVGGNGAVTTAIKYRPGTGPVLEAVRIQNGDERSRRRKKRAKCPSFERQV
jgi:hypothetical protein